MTDTKINAPEAVVRAVLRRAKVATGRRLTNLADEVLGALETANYRVVWTGHPLYREIKLGARVEAYRRAPGDPAWRPATLVAWVLGFDQLHRTVPVVRWDDGVERPVHFADELLQVP